MSGRKVRERQSEWEEGEMEDGEREEGKCSYK